MEGGHIFTKIAPSHLPTYLLIIGYPLYWIELYFIPDQGGHTSFLAWGLFGLICLWALLGCGKKIPAHLSGLWAKFKEASWFSKTIFSIGSILCAAILFISFFASLLPPHLLQEYDVLNYHITLPRQHIILESFALIPWATADLFLMPVDYALAPYWLATPLPNKIPQFIFLMGLLAVTARLFTYFRPDSVKPALLGVFAVAGSHFIGIQMGTAMLDIILCYLLLATLDSFLRKNHAFALIEFSFLFWAKPLLPVQFTVIAIIMLVVCLVLKKFGFAKTALIFNPAEENRLNFSYHKGLGKTCIGFIVLGVILAGPFITKSLIHAGTPLYPLGVGSLTITGGNTNKIQMQSMKDNAQEMIAFKDLYGAGTSPLNFIKHLWLIAVPNKGVNNIFDYPVGLPYLLVLGPFVIFVIKSLKDKSVALIPLFIIVYWITWWFGTQQSRFLYIPIVLMFLTVLTQKKCVTTVLKIGLILSLATVLLSVTRAHKADLFKPGYEVLRAKDKEILAMSDGVERKQLIEMSFHEVAFAEFAVDVRGGKRPFVMAY